MTAPSRGPRTFPGTIAIGAIFGLFAILAVVFFLSVKRRDRHESCRLNLTLLSIEILRADPRHPELWDAVPAGRQFWLQHPRWPIVAVRPIRPQMLICPVYGRTRPGDGTDYRGPVRTLSRLKPDDPFGADRPGNHGPGAGGNVLLRSGELLTVSESDALWRRASETTSD